MARQQRPDGPQRYRCTTALLARTMFPIALALAVAATMLGPRAATAAPATSAWASQGLSFSSAQGLLPAGWVRHPTRAMTRAAFAQSLGLLADWRAARVIPDASWPQDDETTPDPATIVTPPAAQPADPAARALANGWMVKVHGSFSPNAPITADEAARGIVGVLGLTESANTFAARLQAELPGARTNYRLRAYQVYVRALGMRYNHLQGTEQLEVGPAEAMSVAHVAFMLEKAARADDWRLAAVHDYEQFDLGELGPNQRKVLATGVHFVGMPYVWAGESENMQPEGHAGFDCSGFTQRIVNGTALAASARGQALGERTSMSMSDIPGARRVRAIAQLRPVDLVFFGTRGARSKPAENFHVGVYMGNGWFIHSTGSNDGVSIQRLDGWWGDSLSWGRRVLRQR